MRSYEMKEVRIVAHRRSLPAATTLDIISSSSLATLASITTKLSTLRSIVSTFSSPRVCHIPRTPSSTDCLRPRKLLTPRCEQPQV
ncbi:hypothetical protein DOTSEDRAFT_43895 [Dothistroma septosporum NZE10]|uniref:Uncharacterized protein n=1 Tax=Dothistroma septosporum (strain NZE10 / CBS 128990) TaxID=675120 RepID=N1PRP9_DOTSN|nr:hypothetical protein DOTSEDRAFT_43895 [Dothistroma septosporum NZE10]